MPTPRQRHEGYSKLSWSFRPEDQLLAEGKSTGCALSELNGRVAVKRWSIYVLPFVMGTFMAVQSYAASRTWGMVNPSTIAILALSVIGTLFLLGLVAAKRSRD